MFKASPITDQICDTLWERSRKLHNGCMVDKSHLLRLAGLLISASPTEEKALELASSMPTTRDIPGGTHPLSYGQFRLDCEALAWILIL